MTMKGNGEKSGYCSPVIVKHGNRRLLLTMTIKLENLGDYFVTTVMLE